MKTFKYALVRSLPMGSLIYAGSMQYVAIDLLAGGASLISAALMTLMVNARHLFYGISMLERYKNTGAAKPYLIYLLFIIYYLRSYRGRRPRCPAKVARQIPPAGNHRAGRARPLRCGRKMARGTAVGSTSYGPRIYRN